MGKIDLSPQLYISPHLRWPTIGKFNLHVRWGNDQGYYQSFNCACISCLVSRVNGCFLLFPDFSHRTRDGIELCHFDGSPLFLANSLHCHRSIQGVGTPSMAARAKSSFRTFLCTRFTFQWERKLWLWNIGLGFLGRSPTWMEHR